MRSSTLVAALLVSFVAVACAADGAGPGPCAGSECGSGRGSGKADGASDRPIEVLLTEPPCDVCTEADKAVLLERSPIIARVVELLDTATGRVDIAQYTFSRREIEQALLRAHERGVQIRIAMDKGQDRDGTVARRLRDAGLDVRFIEGRSGGLLHTKFMLRHEPGGSILLTGSNNWSSTGTSINEENTIVLHGPADEPQIAAFACHFEAIWEQAYDDAAACSTDDVALTPGGPARRMIRDAIRGAERSVDVLMHHLAFTDLVKELAHAQQRGVQVRVIVNAESRAEHTGRWWDELAAAGGRIRYKQDNADAYQLMHHKLAIIDGRVLIDGSGNWSGSGFFNNFENYVRYRDPKVVARFADLYERLWMWSLSGASLDAGLTAAEQHLADTRVLFGNLHAHIHAEDGGLLLDDGKAERRDADGNPVPVNTGSTVAEIARHAFEYARDQGGLDFLALTPHCSDRQPTDGPDQASMSQEGYDELRSAAADVTAESSGTFLALGGMEWSTNSSGNHVNVLGTRTISHVERGRFDVFYDDWLPARVAEGERPIVMLNHPRTFRVHEDTLQGNWDQVFGVSLQEITNNSQRGKKFNDYGLDDFEPLASVRDDWIAGAALPDEAVVAQTLEAVRRASAPFAALMEVTVSRGTELGTEVPVNPSLTTEEDGTVTRYTHVHRDWDYYLAHGFRLAPTASHDNHLANWGTGHSSRTGVLATALTEEALLDALRRRAVFASEDEDLQVRFYAEARVPMGSETAVIGPRLGAQVYLEDPGFAGPFEVHVYRGRIGGQVELVQTLEAGTGWTSFTAELAEGEGEQLFYLEVLEPGPDRMAWTAPIWVERLQ